MSDPVIHHEESDISIQGVFRFVIGLFVTTVSAFVIIWLLFGYFDRREAAAIPDFPLAVGRERVPPEPRLQVTPREDLHTFREREQAILDGYGWVDRDAGRVRIPINDAMRLTLEQGLPSRTVEAAPLP